MVWEHNESWTYSASTMCHASARQSRAQGRAREFCVKLSFFVTKFFFVSSVTDWSSSPTSTEVLTIGGPHPRRSSQGSMHLLSCFTRRTERRLASPGPVSTFRFILESCVLTAASHHRQHFVCVCVSLFLRDLDVFLCFLRGGFDAAASKGPPPRPPLTCCSSRHTTSHLFNSPFLIRGSFVVKFLFN